MKKRICSRILVLAMALSILPAPALAEETPVYLCKKEAHTHGDGCAAQERKLTCTLTDTPVHTDACPVEGDVYLCTHEDVHKHGEECYTLIPVTICTVEEHIHDVSCQASEAPEAPQCQCPVVAGAVDHAAQCPLYSCSCPMEDGVATHQEGCKKYVPSSPVVLVAEPQTSTTLSGTVSIEWEGNVLEYGKEVRADISNLAYSGTLSYQWLRNHANDSVSAQEIAGATGATYQVSKEDIDHVLFVRVTSSAQTGESITSGCTSFVTKGSWPVSVQDNIESIVASDTTITINLRNYTPEGNPVIRYGWTVAGENEWQWQ